MRIRKKDKKDNNKRLEKKTKEIIKDKNKRPAVCLSLSCKTLEQLEKEIATYKDCCQIVEWCVDSTEGAECYSQVEFTEKLNHVKELCSGKKLIVDYKGDDLVGNRIQRWAMGIADIIDLDADNTEITEMIREAKRNKTKVLISHHEFDGTPERDKIATQFIKMEKLGGDILKVACFAHTEMESYRVLEAAGAYTQLKNHKPIVAIAMGEEGQASRICAGDFGSVITYSCGEVPTAPGQFNARDLTRYLDIYYER